MTTQTASSTFSTAVPAVPRYLIEELHRRLDQIVWPRRATGAAVPGFDTERLRPLVARWRHGFDWCALEARLERLGQIMTTTADGRRLHALHALHARGGEELPILLVHGWPDSLLRFIDLIPRLSAGHDVVAPAIPGFGLSEEPVGEISRELVAEDFHALMTSLGHSRYAVHGGDWGSAIGTTLARLHPEAVAALHLSDVPFDPAFTIDEASATEAEVAYLRSIEHSAGGELYQAGNISQPDVTALALSDSPVGLLAWLAHLYDQWSEEEIDPDHLLANAALLWLTGSVRSSMRLYCEPAGAWDASTWEDAEPAGWGAAASWVPEKPEVPTAFALFPKDLAMAPRALAERHFAVERFTVMPRGGHFAALEQPDLLADDLASFLAGRS